jgi:hypothetical protein
MLAFANLPVSKPLIREPFFPIHKPNLANACRASRSAPKSVNDDSAVFRRSRPIPTALGICPALTCRDGRVPGGLSSPIG